MKATAQSPEKLDLSNSHHQTTEIETGDTDSSIETVDENCVGVGGPNNTERSIVAAHTKYGVQLVRNNSNFRNIEQDSSCQYNFASRSQKQVLENSIAIGVPPSSPLPPRLPPFAASNEKKVTNGTTMMNSGGCVDQVATKRNALAPKTDAVGNKSSSNSESTAAREPMKTNSGGMPPMMPETHRPLSSTANSSNISRLVSTMSTPPRHLNNISNNVLINASRGTSNRLPKNPRDTVGVSSPASQSRRALAAQPVPLSITSQKGSQSSVSSPVPLPELDWVNRTDPESQEQALFEQRLSDDVYGVAVRKISHSGKSQLRYVKCVPLDELDENASAGKSVSSLVRSFTRRRQRCDSDDRDQLLGKKALIWGKKRDSRVPVEKFVSVNTGKTTERTRKNPQPASRLLSLMISDEDAALDIEAPTRLDRDKFARAFARFLQVPLDTNSDEDEDADGQAENSVSNKRTSRSNRKSSKRIVSTTISVPDLEVEQKKSQNQSTSASKKVMSSSVSEVGKKGTIDQGSPVGIIASQNTALFQSAEDDSSGPSNIGKEFIAGGAVISGFNPEKLDKDDKSFVSSLTGGNYDQDIVEELHQALNEVKRELEVSRAESARAVKVAEQAIQSAENSSSRDWNSTVTHKAAEAAAQAQKRSAEAICKQRLAEERLASERRNANFWRCQAEAAEEEAGILQTRAAAAEVRRAALNEELEGERSRTSTLIKNLKERFALSESHQRDALDSAIGRNHALEIELSGTRKDLDSKNEENFLREEMNSDSSSHTIARKKMNVLGKNKKKPDKGEAVSLLATNSTYSEQVERVDTSTRSCAESLQAEEVSKLHAEFTGMKQQFELLKRTTVEEMKSLPETSKLWANLAEEALLSSQTELAQLRNRLALESNTRRKLLHEVQDLRGTVRVYCRPRPFEQPGTTSTTGVISLPSNEILLLHRERIPTSKDVSPLAFEFDRVFTHDTDQKELYNEFEELVLNVLDGYNVCLMAYGQTGSGKSYSMLGEVRYDSADLSGNVVIENYGILLQGAEQLFQVAGHRCNRYEDSFTLSIVEVYDERLTDLLAGTEIENTLGVVDNTELNILQNNSSKSSKRSTCEDEVHSQISSRSRKLEIRTSNDGETIVQGLVALKVTTMQDVLDAWKQVIRSRALRLKDQGIDRQIYEASTHLISTIKISSKNIATGCRSKGKIQFVEFAGADLVQQRSSKIKNPRTNDVLSPVGNKHDWKYANKSLVTLLDVVSAREQFERDVPYRNSTLTHLLQDALEGDCKVMMMVCVDSNPISSQESASALRFASKMKRVDIGKATKHSIPR
eukprot:CAMPEP_0194201758 /NCGR_PEP_ID=MMETSP0156-20130528/1951_1 /TAXON_ID=33649 /ORGANISM="Thalassionema nitzschioides, Strain L26-B" /LENGTH=1311 /DNA_ID=CAMNT_0038927047 /DNA_START=163 /DNA_END=4098 /DNA_ORIENTATION=-